MFNPQPQYGDVLRQQALQHAAPISGAPSVPKPQAGGSSSASPAPTMAPTPGLMVDPYYQRLTDTWRALSKLPGASDEVKAIARRSIQIQQAQER
jgi:hypothetical protein